MISLMAKLGLDSTGFMGAVNTAKAKISTLGAELKASAKANPIAGAMAGMVGVGAIVGGIRSIVDHGGRVTDLADRFSVTTDTVQALDFAATQTGTSVETALGGIKKASMAAADAIAGNDDKMGAFERLGITAAQLRTLSPEQLFMQLANNLKDMPMTAQVFADINDTLGRAGQEMLPMFQQGLQGLMAEAHALGVVMDAETISKLDEMGDTMSAAGMAAKAAFAPLVTFILDGVNLMLGGMRVLSDFVANRLTHVFSAVALAADGKFKDAAKEVLRVSILGFGPGVVDDFMDAARKETDRRVLSRSNNDAKKKNEQRAKNMKGGGFADEDGGGNKAESLLNKEAAEVAKLQKQIEDRRIARLPEEQRLALLQKELAQAKKDAADTNNDGSVENLRAQARVAELEDRVSKMAKPGEKGGIKEDARLDSIQQIGGRIGENAAVQNGVKQLKTLEEMLTEIRAGNLNTAVLKP